MDEQDVLRQVRELTPAEAQQELDEAMRNDKLSEAYLNRHSPRHKPVADYIGTLRERADG